MRGSVDMNFLFTLGEVQRLVRAYADKQAARYGITRAQWAVLAKVERNEGLKQSELAEQMEMQPITLTRLIDRLCDNDWIERRGDDTDRRVNRLYLRKAARPLLGKLGGLRSGLTFYLNGGRYVTTDDAYVGAQKVLITPDVSGKIINIAVKEGQSVATGDVMFQIDPVPFQLALAQARAKLDDAKTSHDNLVANVKLYSQTMAISNSGRTSK